MNGMLIAKSGELSIVTLPVKVNEPREYLAMLNLVVKDSELLNRLIYSFLGYETQKERYEAVDRMLKDYETPQIIKLINSLRDIVAGGALPQNEVIKMKNNFRVDVVFINNGDDWFIERSNTN